MSKRQISKQQSARIALHQHRYQQSAGNMTDGLVITRFGKQAEVEDETGRRFICALRPNLPALVAGDRVVWQAENETQGVVLSLYPRTSLLARPTERGSEKPVAANITQLMIVIASQPEMDWALLDSYLIMAEVLKLKPVIVLNKIDLPCETINQILLHHYKPLNYDILMTSLPHQIGLSALQHTLNHQNSVFVGQSGVGKSSLIASFLPEEVIRTQTLSAETALGKHTTSSSRYYHLPSGGALIDSPGVRVFGLWKMNDKEIAQGYREFSPYLSQCKFRNCSHQDTPGCAILAAMNQGQISAKRYEHFLKLCRQSSGMT